MDYTQVFKNLNTSRVKRKHSPHKAVLLLALMELFEEEQITENRFVYDDSIKTRFHQVWNRFLIDDELFQATPHLPFWFLSSDGFWHIAPTIGNQYLVQAFLQARVKISESKLVECVSHATLDEDLYFQFSMPTSRKVFREILLSTYLYQTEDEIADYLKERDFKDDSKSISTEKPCNDDDSEFNKVNEDVQILLNIEYYTFLKDNREYRERFKELFPTPAALYKRIAVDPLKHGDLQGLFEYTYSSFLRDMSLSMMSNDYVIDFIDAIDKAVEILEGNESVDLAEDKGTNDQEPQLSTYESEDTTIPQYEEDSLYVESEDVLSSDNNSAETDASNDISKTQRKGLPWTEEEENRIKRLYGLGYSFDEIATAIGRTELAIKARLGYLGIIDYSYEAEEPKEEVIEEPQEINVKNLYIGNAGGYCVLYNENREKVFTDKGFLITINDSIYRLNRKYECLTIKKLTYKNNTWKKGGKLIVAYNDSPLFQSMKIGSFIDHIEDIQEFADFQSNKIKFAKRWYDCDGYLIRNEEEPVKTNSASDFIEEESDYTPSWTRKKWATREKKDLAIFYKQGMNIYMLAQYFNRDIKDVREELTKLGLI